MSPEFRQSESEAYDASVCVCLSIRRAVLFSAIHIHGVVLSEHRNYVFFFYLRGLIFLPLFFFYFLCTLSEGKNGGLAEMWDGGEGGI